MSPYKITAEYIWIDGRKPTAKLRSKTKIISGLVTKLEHIPPWGFDGSSTEQAEGHFSDCMLKPVYYVTDPINKAPNILVMCEVLNPDGTPHPSNTRHVLAAVAAKLIGFTITNGGTLATTAQYDSGGGGVFCDGYSQAPVISNCIITGNSANGEASRFGGGGTYCGTLRNCQLIGNTSVKEGGASWLTAMYNCLLIGNSAGTHGGGASEGNLYNCTLTGNSAGSWGGGGYNNVLLDNCTFISNSATLYGGGAAEFTTVYNCKLIGNSASDCGGGAFIGSSGGKMYNCLVVGNSSGTIGGGFYSGALYNSTVIGNKAGTGGGGTYGSAQYNSIIYFNTSTSGGGPRRAYCAINGKGLS